MKFLYLGKVGGYVDYLSREEIAWMERRIAQTLDPLFGYGEPPALRAAGQAALAGVHTDAGPDSHP